MEMLSTSCWRDAVSVASPPRTFRRRTSRALDAAFAAPSANNARPWHFVLVRDPTTRSRLKGLHQWNWMLDKAPLVIAVLGNDDDDPWWIEDCAAATENILLEATALGLEASGAACARTRAPLSGTNAPAAKCSASPRADGARWRSSASATRERRRSRARSARRQISYESSASAHAEPETGGTKAGRHANLASGQPPGFSRPPARCFAWQGAAAPGIPAAASAS